MWMRLLQVLPSDTHIRVFQGDFQCSTHVQLPNWRTRVLFYLTPVLSVDQSCMVKPSRSIKALVSTVWGVARAWQLPFHNKAYHLGKKDYKKYLFFVVVCLLACLFCCRQLLFTVFIVWASTVMNSFFFYRGWSLHLPEENKEFSQNSRKLSGGNKTNKSG